MDSKTGQQTDNSLKTLLDAVLLLSSNGDLKEAFHQSSALVVPLLGAEGLLLYTLAEKEGAVRGKLYAGIFLRQGEWQEVESTLLAQLPNRPTSFPIDKASRQASPSCSSNWRAIKLKAG